MKLDKHIIETDKSEISIQAEVNQKQVNWQIKNMHRGHRLYEINTETGETSIAKYDDGTDIVFTTLFGKSANLQTVTRSVKQNKDCVYIPALNKLGAINKFAKQAQKLING